jgi:hypothetical protein
LVDEVNYGISQVDPKKTVQLGSFRVDGNGNQNTYNPKNINFRIDTLNSGNNPRS